MIKRPLLLGLTIGAIALATACGGGGGGGGSAPATNLGGSGNLVLPTAPATAGAVTTQTVPMALTITIPKTTSKSSTRSRGPQYIAPNSGSIKMTLLSVNGVTVTGAPAQGPFNLTLGPTNPSCVAG